MRICNLLFLGLLITATSSVATPPALTEKEQLIGELMLSHDRGKIEHALRIIYHELNVASTKAKPRWLSLAGLCELELAAQDRSSARAKVRSKRGFELLLQAGHAGDSNAAMTLSDMYRQGEPPAPKDLAKSKYWNDRALYGKGRK